MAITNFLFNPTTIAECCALLAALLFLPRKNRLYPGVFLYYLVFVLIIEATGSMFRSLGLPNGQLYNGLLLVQGLLFSWIFGRYEQEPRMKTIIRKVIPVFLGVFIIETFYRVFNAPPEAQYNKYCKLMLVVMVLTYSFSFYVGLLKENSTKSILSEGRFWIVTGLFFFYISSTPMASFQDQISSIRLRGNISFYTLVMGCINVILYGCWIIAFLCLRKTSSNRSSSFLPSLRW